MSKKLLDVPLFGGAGRLVGEVGDDGKAHLSASYEKDGVEVKVEVVGSPKAALDHLKEVIPGKIDDMVIDAAEVYLGLK